MKMSHTFFALVMILGALSAQDVWAEDDELDLIGPRPACGPFDRDCSKRILKMLSGIHLLEPTVSGGVRVGDDEAAGVGSLGGSVVSIDAIGGDLDVVEFNATYLPDAGGVRLQFSLAKASVLYFCKDAETGELRPPLVSMFQHECAEEGRYGIGAELARLQVDTATGRFAARWAEVKGVFNILNNANNDDYLKKHVFAFAGTSLDTVWRASTPSTSGASGSETSLRLDVGVAGMIRPTADNHWEIRGAFHYRPDVFDMAGDYALEAETQVLYHFLFIGRDADGDLTPTAIGSVGLDTRYSYWSDPSVSIGDFTSDRDQHSAFVGAVFNVMFN